MQNHPLTGWIANKGWCWFPHQIETLKAARDGKDVIVFAPTGAGKTLSGFLPSLVDLHEYGSNGHLHTLYISPLKALAVDVHRNIGKPVEDLKLPITYETRTGDTPQSRRQRQRNKPPDILMTTPESLALLLSYEDSDKYFKHLKYFIFDELHALLHTKRGDLLSLNIERLSKLAPKARRIGLSATLADKKTAKDWLCRTRKGKIVTAPNVTKPEIDILYTDEHRMPWAGHMAGYAIEEIYKKLLDAKMTVVFVNTRAQSEFIFQRLWAINENDLKIAVHHGSLERELRRKVEAQMAAGTLDCVVATSSLDLGLDWADVDLVMQIGAPKGVSRLLQRIGRSNHRLNEPSRAVLVPTNRFEYLECLAAVKGAEKNKLDGIEPKDGGLDVLAQHIFARACARPFDADQFYKEVLKAWPYRSLSRADFDAVLSFVKDGGYALQSYERFSRLVINDKGLYQLRDKRDTRRYRMNIGTIVEAPLLKVQLKNRTLGTIEERFVQNLAPGDTFYFAGMVLAYQSFRDGAVMVSKTKDGNPQIANYAGGRMPMSTNLSDSIRYMLGHSRQWAQMPAQIKDWLSLHKEKSIMPDEKSLLVETFPHEKKHYMVAYTFAGWHANQTLGFLILRRMRRMGARPLGFVQSDYALTAWSLKPLKDVENLFDPNIFYEEFEDWLSETPLIRRMFRDAAVISGLVERRHPGATKTGKQVLMSTDLIFDVLMKYDPDHILIKAARNDALGGLIDADRLAKFLQNVQGHVIHKALDKVSPLAVPMLLKITKESLSRNQEEDYALEDLEAEILNKAGLL